MKPPQWFEAIGIPEECVSKASAAQEHGRRFSVAPRQEDQIWRVRLDGCWLQDEAEKRVDYLFWGQSASGRKVILLVELKGQDFGTALQQIESTLLRLCKRVADNTVHMGKHQASPGHDSPRVGGVKAFVILSKGVGVRQRLRQREALRQKYGVRVHTRERRLEVNGLDALLS